MSAYTDHSSLGELARTAGLSRDALAMLATLARMKPEVSLEDYSRALLAEGLGEDALRLVARSLPRKFVLAWACDCVKQVLKPDSPSYETDRAGVALAEGWLANPIEKHRRLALEFAERNGFECAGAWIAAAVGWMEGSLAPEGYEVVSPPESLIYDAVIAAQTMAVVSDPETMPQWLARFVIGAAPGVAAAGA